MGAVGDLVLGEHRREPAERVRLDHIDADVEIRGMEVGHHVGPRHVEDLRAPFELRAAEVVERQVAGMDTGAGRPVEHHDAFTHGVEKGTHASMLRAGVHAQGQFPRRAAVGTGWATGKAGRVTLDALAAVARIGGVVSHVSSIPVDPAGAALSVRVAHVGRGLHPDALDGALDGIGVGADAQTAESAAVSNGLRNYASAAWDPSDFRWASAEDLGQDALDVEDLPRAQPLDVRDRIRWVEGWELGDGRPVWVPAVMAYVGLPPAVEAETFWPQSSDGCAAGSDLGSAVTSALLECVERDAMAVTWLLRRPLTRIHGADHAVGALEGCGVEPIVLDATTDLGIPVVVAVLRGGEAPTTVAAACRPSPSEAAARAVAEAVGVRTLAAQGAPSAGEPAWEFLDGGQTAKIDELAPADIRKPALMARLASLGLRAFAVDLTCDELADIGAAAARVIVPGLQPAPPDDTGRRPVQTPFA